MIYFGYCAFILALVGFSYAVISLIVARLRSINQKPASQPRKAYAKRNAHTSL